MLPVGFLFNLITSRKKVGKNEAHCDKFFKKMFLSPFMLTDKMKDATKAREEVLKGDQSNEENLDEPELTPRIRKKQTASAGE